MKELVSTFKHNFKDGFLKVTEVKDFKGEASCSIRKGKKIVSFEYKMQLKWELHMIESADKPENVIGKIKGEWEWPDVSHDVLEDGDEWEVRTSIDEDEKKLASVYNQLIRMFAPNDLRELIKDKFVKELMKK